MVNQDVILKNIRTLLKVRNLSYEQFGELIGKTKETVNNYFQGRTKITLEILLKMSEALGVSPCYFFDCGQNTIGVQNSGNVVAGKMAISQQVGTGNYVNGQSEDVEMVKKVYQELISEKERIIEEKDKQIELLKQMIEMLKNQQRSS